MKQMFKPHLFKMASNNELSWSNEGDSISECSQQVMSLYCSILDSNCPSQTRIEHEKLMEEFRIHSPYCVQVGLFLIKQQNELLGIHLGLQLLQYFVRYRWSCLQSTEQCQLRDEMMQYRTEIGDLVLPLYIKEGISRVIVEIVKKMWPQDWPTFVTEIFTVEDKVCQIELILLVFRRLAEDVLSYDTSLPHDRKSLILAQLKEDTPVLNQLFNLFITVFQVNGVSSSLCEIAITTLSSLVDWVDIEYLTIKDCQIIFLLLSLLFSTSEYRLIICDCLTGIFSRKCASNKRQYRELFLTVLSLEVLSQLEHCISVSIELSCNDEEEYIFLKKTSQMMVQLGTCQLGPLWDTNDFNPPVHLNQYFNVMLLLFSHPSLLISSTCLEFWNAVVHHQFMKTHSVFLNILPQLVKLFRDKQLKVGDPTQPLHISSHYSNIDFNGPDEYHVTFSRCKTIVNRLLTDVVQINPSLLQGEAINAVHLLVTKQHTINETSGSTKMSPIFLEWDATCSFLECWVVGLDQCSSIIKQEASSTGVSIVRALLSYNPVDSTSAYCHLKSLENGLQSFIVYNSDELLQGYLEKILTYVIYPGTEINKLSLSREQKQTRMNALYCLINLVKSYAKSLQSATQQLLDHYDSLLVSDLLLYSEKCLFIEAFTILSHFQTPNEQDMLLGHLINETQLLVQSSFKSVVSSLPLLIQYLSLDKESSDYNNNNNLVQLCYCVHSIMGILQTSTPRIKKQCGAPEISTSSPSSFKYIVPLLMEFIFPFLKVLLELWSDSSKPLLSVSYQSIHSLHQHDRDAILGIQSTVTEQNESNRVHQQLIAAYDQCIMSVGFAWVNYGPDLLSQVGFIERLMNTLLLQLEHTNQLRIKPIIKNIISSMIVTCPPCHWQTSLTPVLSRFCSITFNCLQKNWCSINSQSIQEDGNTLSDQVVMQQFTVNLTRQYIQLISTICINKDVVINDTEDPTGVTNKKVDVLSDLVLSLFHNDEMQRILMLSIFVPLTWLDGHSVGKCLNVATVIFDKVHPNQFGEKFIYQIMEQLLMGLSVHGEDGGLCISLITLALHLYENTASSYPTLYNLLTTLPDCNEGKVQSFNRLLSTESVTSKQVKKKKESFRKLLSGVIGKPLGQLYKLPPIYLGTPTTVKRDQRSTQAVSYEGITSLFGDQS